MATTYRGGFGDVLCRATGRGTMEQLRRPPNTGRILPKVENAR